MKKECEIIQDLLFGYSDGILSDSSKEFIEKHTKECDECNRLLEEIQNDKKQKVEEKEVEYLKKINKKMKRKTGIISITTILLGMLIVFNIFVFKNYKKYAEEMEIFLSNDITQEQLENIEREIKAIYAKSEIIYKSEEEALENMKEKLGDNSNLLSNFTEANNIFPSSYIVRTKVDKVEEIASKLITMPGVEHITTNIKANPYALFVFSLKQDS